MGMVSDMGGVRVLSLKSWGGLGGVSMGMVSGMGGVCVLSLKSWAGLGGFSDIDGVCVLSLCGLAVDVSLVLLLLLMLVSRHPRLLLRL